jgi:hypothetical protein
MDRRGRVRDICFASSRHVPHERMGILDGVKGRSERVVITLTLVAGLIRLLSVFRFHPLNWDEIEYYRATDWVRRGLIPYRDFWEHHTPLQWFVFAPLAALVHGSGAAPVLWMRVGQIPLWIAAFWLLMRWMASTGIGVIGRWSALSLLFCSTFFMHAAVEYRIDVLGCALMVTALLLLTRARRPAAAIGAGVALGLVVMANIRFAPIVAVAFGGCWIRWRDRRAVRMTAGVAAIAALGGLYLLSTGSFVQALRSVWTDNYVADSLAPPVHFLFLHRLLTPFGIRLLEGRLAPSSIEPATIALFLLGIAGWIRSLRGRDPEMFFLAFLESANLAFVAMMKYVFNYHFELSMVLLLPFVGLEIDRWMGSRSLRRLVLAGLVVAVSINFVVVMFRAKEGDLAYQDLIMRAADRRTPPDGRVFDGVGWALQRKPAYRYWFLRENVHWLEVGKRIEPLALAELQANPPAAVISDFSARLWLSRHPAVARWILRQYLPVWRDLWLPAMSARLAPGGTATWTVSADGDYRVYASSALAEHPWLHGNPLATGSFGDEGATLYLRTIKSDAMVTWSRPTEGLRRGQTLQVWSRDPRPVGVMVVPAAETILFRQPAADVDLDGAVPPRWHVPSW